jgi:hypothetical protein
MTDNPKLFHRERSFMEGPLEITTDITLRDLFAAAALTGIIAACDEPLGSSYEPKMVSSDAYAVADAMLKERAER